MNIKLRRANEHDIKVISELLHQYDLFEHKLDTRIEVDSKKTYKKELARMFKDNSYIFILAEDKSEVVGVINYAVWKQGKMKAGAIDDMFIIDAYRHRGIGKRMAQYVLNEMKKQKCRFVKSGVRPKNRNSQKFWKKQGFKINYRYQPDYSMQKEL